MRALAFPHGGACGRRFSFMARGRAAAAWTVPPSGSAKARVFIDWVAALMREHAPVAG